MSLDGGVARVLRRARCCPAGESGQALAEMMLVVPVVLLLLLVILDGGMAFDRRETILTGLREGARSAAAGDSVSRVVNTTVDRSDGVLTPSDVSVCYLDGPDGNSYPGDLGDAVRVTIDYQYQTVFSGGMLATIGVGVPTFDMSPVAEGILLRAVSGASSC
jgi:hypothetical protein